MIEKGIDVGPMRHTRSLLSAQNRAEQLFIDVAKQVGKQVGESEEKSRTLWLINSEQVCRAFWAHAHNTTSKTLSSTTALIKAGHTRPLEHAEQRLPRPKAGIQEAKADAFFLDLYKDLGEPMAVEDNAMDPEHVELTDQSHPLWALSSVLHADERRVVPVR